MILVVYLGRGIFSSAVAKQFYFSPNQSSGDVLSSQIEENFGKKTRCTSIVARVARALAFRWLNMRNSTTRFPSHIHEWSPAPPRWQRSVAVYFLCFLSRFLDDAGALRC